MTDEGLLLPLLLSQRQTQRASHSGPISSVTDPASPGPSAAWWHRAGTGGGVPQGKAWWDRRGRGESREVGRGPGTSVMRPQGNCTEQTARTGSGPLPDPSPLALCRLRLGRGPVRASSAPLLPGSLLASPLGSREDETVSRASQTTHLCVTGTVRLSWGCCERRTLCWACPWGPGRP